MRLLLQDQPEAKAAAVAVVLLAVLGEAVVTYGAGDRDAAPSRKVAAAMRALGATVLARNGGRSSTTDRRTREVLLLGVWAALLVEWTIAKDAPGLRLGANSWLTLVAGAVIAALGIALRVRSVHTLGRFFRRQVVIEPGQTVVRDGPYRWVRHPAYAGNIVMVFGIGLMFGSWVGAVAGCVIALATHLPRIHVEERALRAAFGADYEGYAAQTARLVPGVW